MGLVAGLCAAETLVDLNRTSQVRHAHPKNGNARYRQTASDDHNPLGHNGNPYLLSHLKMTKPNQVWGMDTTSILMATGLVTRACVMNIYSRKSLSSRISKTLNTSFCVDATTEPVRFQGPPESKNTDQGSQYH